MRPRKHVVTLAMDEGLKRILNRVAREEEVSQSAIVRKALKAFFVARNITLPNDSVEVA